MKRTLLLTLGICATSAALHGQTTTLWNFNSTISDTSTASGVLTPATGTGSLALVGGTLSTFAGGSTTDPAPSADNSGLNASTYPAQGANNKAAGVRYSVSTVGFLEGIEIKLDLRLSGTASRFFQLQLSSDGINFADAVGGVATVGGPLNSNTNVSFTDAGLYSHTASSASQTFVSNITYTLPDGSLFEDNSNFAFRWVSTFAPTTSTYISSNAGTSAAYSVSGTTRFDMVSVTPVPEPTSVGLVFAGMAVLGGWRRFRRVA